MQRVESREDLWQIIRRWRREGHRIALVPTMGNLHEGHLALVRSARENSDRVITSIYVNPTQFGEGEDYGRYPRTLESDLERLLEEECDLVFVPDNATMYPHEGEHAVKLLAAPALASSFRMRVALALFSLVVIAAMARSILRMHLVPRWLPAPGPTKRSCLQKKTPTGSADRGFKRSPGAGLRNWHEGRGSIGVRYCCIHARDPVSRHPL